MPSRGIKIKGFVFLSNPLEGIASEKNRFQPKRMIMKTPKDKAFEKYPPWRSILPGIFLSFPLPLRSVGLSYPSSAPLINFDLRSVLA